MAHKYTHAHCENCGRVFPLDAEGEPVADVAGEAPDPLDGDWYTRLDPDGVVPVAICPDPCGALLYLAPSQWTRGTAPKSPRRGSPRQDGRGPVIHFASRSDAGELVHAGPALCKAGMANRTENEQYVAGDWSYVDCRTCHRLKDAKNRREEREERDEYEERHMSPAQRANTRRARRESETGGRG